MMAGLLRRAGVQDRSSSVRMRLVQLAAAVAAPLILLSAVSVWSAYGSQRERQEAALLGRAEAAAAMVDREFDGAMWALRTLSGSKALGQGDLDGFELEMRGTSRALGGAMVILTRPSGEVAMSTFWKEGERLSGIQGNPFIQAALREKRAMVSDIVQHPLSLRQEVGVAVPAAFGAAAEASWNLSLYLPDNALAETLASLHLPPSWLASVLDRHNHTVARTRDAAAYVGKMPPADFVEALGAADAGIIGGNHRAADGVPTLSAFARAPRTGYVVAIGIPESDFTGPLRATLLRTAGFATLLTMLGVAGALLLSGRIVQALRRVAGAAPGTAPVTGLREVDELARAIAAAEALRQETAEGFRLLAETMPGCVFMTDAAGGAVYVNAAYVEQTGRAEAELMGDGWLATVHADDRDQVRTAWARAVQSGSDYAAEYRGLIGDQSYRRWLARARPLRDAGGAVVRWFGVAVDVTPLWEAEERLRVANQDLEARVCAEVTARESAQARAAQAERLQALGQLAGGIAHDFNNVLQATQGGAALIERRPGDLEGVRRFARMITDAAERGAAITRRLLAFSRQGDLRAAPMDPAFLLIGMRDILVHTIGTGIEVTVDAAAGLPALLADKGQLETVLINLATNARDAMSGVGQLGFSAAVDVVRHAGESRRQVALAAGEYVCLSVSDTGAGMDAATLARASEPFFTTKPMGKGTGLGLAMARGFAEQSGGGLSIESLPGRGTTVRLWLPAAEARGLAEAAGARAEAADQSCARLLMVDDDAAVLETMAQQMEAAGFVVLPMASGQMALAMLDAGEAVDVIVSDLSMPGMDGMAVIQEVQRRRPGLPAILLTGYATNAAEIATGGALSGAFTLLRKPVDGQSLAERIRFLLEEHAGVRGGGLAARSAAMQADVVGR